MCWEEQCVILNQTILNMIIGTRCLPTFSLQSLQIMMNFVRFKNQRSFICSRLKDEKGWCFGEKTRFKDGAGCSEERIPISSSILELCPSFLCPLSPWIHAESIYSPMSMFQWHTVTALTWIMGKDQHSAEPKWLIFGQTSQNRAGSGNFSALVFFQVWDTIFCPCFCKISASNHTMCNPMGIALKGTCKGQHSQYMALLKGQVCVAPRKSYLQKLTAAVSYLETKLCLLKPFGFFCGPVSEVGGSPLHSFKKP